MLEIEMQSKIKSWIQWRKIQILTRCVSSSKKKLRLLKTTKWNVLCRSMKESDSLLNILDDYQLMVVTFLFPLSSRNVSSFFQSGYNVQKYSFKISRYLSRIMLHYFVIDNRYIWKALEILLEKSVTWHMCELK